MQTFVKDGEERPPLTTDGERWQNLIVDWEGWVTVRLMTGEKKGFVFEPDVDAKTIAFATYQDRDAKLTWTYEQPTPETLNLTGELAGSTFSITTTRRVPEDFLLMNRGFNWVNEVARPHP